MARKMAAAVALGRRGGKSKSEAKKRAVRENGRKGGSQTHREVFEAGWRLALACTDKFGDQWQTIDDAFAEYQQSRKTPKEQGREQ